MRFLALSVCLSGIGVAACAEAPGVELTVQAICPPMGCGQSPVIAGVGFHELYEDTTTANAEGFVMKEMSKDGVSYKVDVFEGRIIGRNSNGDDLEDADLVGSKIRVMNPLKFGMKPFFIHIDGYQPIQSWARINGATKSIAAYQFRVETDPDRFQDLCIATQLPHRPDPDLLGLPITLTVVFDDEHIEPKSKKMSLRPGVMTFGCAGTATAKLVVNLHTRSSHALGGATTILQDQAFLKMLTADYCRKGKAFTVRGQPLLWIDKHQYTTYGLWKQMYNPIPSLTIEARWNENGPICLNAADDGPRVDANPTDASDLAFGGDGDVNNDIDAECDNPIPDCTDPSVGNFDGAYIVSANPDLPPL